MHLNARKESFSRAYMSALCSSVGCAIAEWNVDADSVDMTLKMLGARGVFRNPLLDVQLKATARASVTADGVKFPLKTKNFSDLRERSHCPRILVVVTIPSDDVAEWLDELDTSRLVLMGRAYWAQPANLPASRNVRSTTIALDRQLTVDALTDLMDRISYDRPLIDT